MGKARKFSRYTLVAAGLAVSLAALVAQLCAAWAGWLPPQAHPRVSLLPFLFPVCLAANVLLAVFWMAVSRRYVAIPLLAILLTLPTARAVLPLNWPKQAPEGSIEVMTYNVFNLYKSSPELPLADSPTVQYLLYSGADIICCQEANSTNSPAVDSLFATVYPYRVYTPWVGGEFFACLSRYPILQTDTLLLPDSTGASLVYHIKVADSDTLRVINNHLASYRLDPDDKAGYKAMLTEPSDTTVRRELRTLLPKLMEANRKRGPQADFIDDYVRRTGARRLVCLGDFNDTPMSYVHYRLTRHLNDAHTRSANGPGLSYHRSGMYFRIDHLLTSPDIEAFGARVDRTAGESDHYPLRCRIVLK